METFWKILSKIDQEDDIFYDRQLNKNDGRTHRPGIANPDVEKQVK